MNIRCNYQRQYQKYKYHTISTATTVFKDSDQTDDRFLQQIEVTIEKVVCHYEQTYNFNPIQPDVDRMRKMFDTTNIPPLDRDVINIVRYLYDRIHRMKEQNICRRCWYPKSKYCICPVLLPIILPEYIQQIYILTHYKEIGMMIDTMKLLLCVYPNHCQLVVGGISELYQTSMNDMNTLIQSEGKNSNSKTLVLFPSSDAVTFPSYYEQQTTHSEDHNFQLNQGTSYNIIVLDATWEQARRLYHRHIVQPTTYPDQNKKSLVHIQLSETSLQSLQQKGIESQIQSAAQPKDSIKMIGQQLRPHPISVREIATAHAVQLLLHDIITMTTINDQSATLASKQASLEIHDQQKRTFDQYQQIAIDTALKVKN